MTKAGESGPCVAQEVLCGWAHSQYMIVATYARELMLWMSLFAFASVRGLVAFDLFQRPAINQFWAIHQRRISRSQ